MKYRFSLTLAFIGLIFLSCDKSKISPEVITQEKTTKIISTLSADSMNGRRAFTPGIAKAANYISRKFDEIGLEPLNGKADDYLQRFTLFSVKPVFSALSVNGQKIERDAYFLRSSQQKINWAQLKNIETAAIAAGDNFSDTFSELSKQDKNLVVLIDPSHRYTFERFSNYYGNGSQTLNPGEGSSKLFVLISDNAISTGSFDFTASVTEKEGFNVAGKIPGTSKKNEKVVFSAHYDHLGSLEAVEGDSVANGADDDASGTTSVIMLADYFKQRGPQERTLIFVAFTAEEMGGYGSKYFSQQLDPRLITAMFNIEMVGKPSKFGPNTAFLTGFEKTSMGKTLQSNLKGTPYMIHPDPYPEQNLFYRSDNATLARLGVPAHTVSSVEIDKDQYYHTVNDELNTLNMEHLTNMIRAIALSSRSIVNGNDTPSRLDASELE